MGITKEVPCGNKVVTVSLSTEVACLTASEYIAANCTLPRYEYSFWVDVCKTIKQYDKLRTRLLERFSKKSEVKIPSYCSALRIDFAHCDMSAVTFWESHKQYLCDYGNRGFREFVEIQIEDAQTKIELVYPTDYYDLLDILLQYVTDDWMVAEKKASKKRFGSKTPKLSYSAQTIDKFLSENKGYIDLFTAGVSAWKKHEAQASEKKVLRIDSQYFFERSCGFDVDAKYSEICAVRDKIRDSWSPGEASVEYAIKWFTAAESSYIRSIEKNCESRYRFDCIVLSKPDFIDDPQEYDHILVGSSGVVLIETKHWKGTVEIRADGKWLRKTDINSPVEGIENPKFQMRRHEVLMKYILPDVPVYSLLCFSNSTIIIDGKENFKDYPIVTTDQLESVLASLCMNGSYTKDDVDRMVSIIEAHKEYTPRKN